MTIYRVFKANHAFSSKEIVNVFDLGYLGGVENDFPEQKSAAIPNRKKRNQVGTRRKRV
jgi:hypothetical protein